MSDPTYSEAEPTVAAEPTVPSGAARFTLGREIGRGGMGRVVEAVDRQFDRLVAVKLHIGKAGATRFETEGKLTGQLEHPAIPTVHERGTLADGTPFYAMQLAQGRTLSEALRASEDLEDRLRLLPVLVQVAHALGYAHQRGVVHRDVKPDNILVGDHGRVFLLDWGIAKHQDRVVTATPSTSGDPTHTMQGSVMGTPAYMAPEQARGEVNRIDARTDVFAMGAVLYHMLVGRSPYVGATAEIALGQAIQARWEPLDRAAPNAPKGLREICTRAMAAAPNERFRDALEMSAALECFQSTAVLARSGDRVERFATFGTWATLVILVLTAAVTWRMLPGVQAQGAMVFPYFASFGLGSVLSVLEWRTAGRHKLEPLLLALAGVTFLFGLAGTGVNLVSIVYALQRPEFADPTEFRRVSVLGLGEAIGNVPGSALFAGIQLVLWGIARRAAVR